MIYCYAGNPCEGEFREHKHIFYRLAVTDGPASHIKYPETILALVIH